MRINRKEYLDKVKGCWLGKTIGGTLGAPMEWERAFNNVDFYLQDLKGRPVPNDDLDLQLIWLAALEYYGMKLTATDLGEFFLKFVTPLWAEYGMAKCNLQNGILPPFSGMVDNQFRNSCGCYIRSEIWACIAPGMPDVAVGYALKDASVDHGWGEGAYAEAFCAALETCAFVEKDINVLIEIALKYIPEECSCTKVVRLAQNLYKKGCTLREARDEVIRNFHSGYHVSVCKEDKEKGFDGGEIGEEAATNLGMIILALLYGEGDFEKSVCYAVNCGEDTDCTAGTVGAFFGILQGAAALPAKWKKPIGESIVTMCIAQGEIDLPKTVNELTERVTAITDQVLASKKKFFRTSGNTEITDSEREKIINPDFKALYRDVDGIFYRCGMTDVIVKYPKGMRTDEEGKISVEFVFDNVINLPARIFVSVMPDDYLEPIGNSEKSFILAHNYPHLGDEAFIGRKNICFDFQKKYSGAADTDLSFEIIPEGRAQKFIIPVKVLL